MLSDEQLEALTNEIDDFQRNRHKKGRGVIRKLKAAEKNEIIKSIRQRADAHWLNDLIAHALVNHDIPDPLLSIDDTVLLALDDTIDRAIASLGQGLMLEQARIMPAGRLFIIDHDDPLDQQLMSRLGKHVSSNGEP